MDQNKYPAAKAVKRHVRTHALRILAVLLSLLALLTLLVNLSTGAARFFGRLPVLGKLSRALRFCHGSAVRVDNDYLQPLNLTQTVGEDSVCVDFLIVDGQTVTVFYRLESDRAETCYLNPSFLLPDGSEAAACCTVLGNSYSDGPLEGMESVSLIFPQAPPASLQMRVQLMDAALPQEERRQQSKRFSFLLDYDPANTSAGRHIDADQQIVFTQLDDSTLKLRVVGIDVYPAHVNFTVEADPENAFWFDTLDYHVLTVDGTRFDALGSDAVHYDADWSEPSHPYAESRAERGLFRFSEDDGALRATLRVDSPLLEKAGFLSLVLTGAELCSKQVERSIRVDLAAARAEALPEGVTLIGAEREGADWLLRFHSEAETSLPGEEYFRVYDPQLRPWGWIDWSYGEAEPGAPGGSEQTARLVNYPFDACYLVADGGFGCYPEGVQARFSLNAQ